MKNIQSRKWITILALILVVVGAIAAGTARADRWHGHGGHWRGEILFGVPWFYPPPRYYYPPVVIREPPPPVYIERETQPPAENYWYYCVEGKGYYPYVKTCPGGWLKVVPEEPDNRR